MGTVNYEGGAAKVKQVETHTVGGTIEADDLFRIAIGNKTLEVVAASTVAETVADNIVAAYAALTQALWPEFYEAVEADGSGGAYTLTSRTAGRPFTTTITSVESGGGAPDLQTFVKTSDTAATGPEHWNDADNWSGGAVPVAGDDVTLEDANDDIRYDLDQSAVALTSLTIKQSFVGTVGNPTQNADGQVANAYYPEYRGKYLEFDATTLDIGEGEGDGSGRLKLDAVLTNCTATIHNTGTRLETAVPPLLLYGGTYDELNVEKGDVGVAFFVGDTATITLLNVGYRATRASDASVICGAGCTITTVKQTGGTLDVNLTTATITTVTVYGGTLTLRGDTNGITSLTIHDSGTVIDLGGSGTIATLVNYGTYDHGQSTEPRTITNVSLYGSASYLDPHDVVTETNGIDRHSGSVTITKPARKTLTFSDV